ncbi:NADH-quinone oxidoreductase subunit H [Candidatus Bathyarchaeota archaeon]|nr:NADH-quinone oxidoreductase subunit H [Candidatus Bathyarchaeota archaeon]
MDLEDLILQTAILTSASFILGIIYNYEVRKISARLQSRKGPWLIVPRPLRKSLGTTRIFQPLYDIIKLLCKETIIPSTARKRLFIAAPLIAFLCLVGASAIVPIGGYSDLSSFDLSLVALLYLLLGVPFAFILGGSVSSSPWGILGGQREADLMLAYETPIVIGAFTTAMMAGSMSIKKIQVAQTLSLPYLILNPFAAVAVLLGIIGKLHLKPFDIPEAEVEVVAGPVTEYSGKLLGVIEINKMLLTSVCTGLFVDLFMAGGAIPGLNLHSPVTVLTYVIEGLLVVAVASLIHTSNPRFRIDQTLEWYVRTPIILAVIGLCWAYILRYIYPTLSG